MRAASVRRFGLVPLAVFSLLFGALATMSPAIVDAQGPQPRTFLREGAVVTKAADKAALLSPKSAVETGFQDTTVFSGPSSQLVNPTAIRFSPDGRVFVALKSGIILVFPNINTNTSTVFADLSAKVDNYWDRGLLGMTLDPGFPTTPYVYVDYAYDAPIGGTAPVWNDACGTPPGATTDGCVISGRLSRLTANGNVMSTEKVLINDWCQQFPSHSMGALNFGVDGALYMSAGDGASFTTEDYGQMGGTLSGTPTPANPCADPPSPRGTALTPPTAEGGALRAQSLRRPAGQPVALNGAILRLDPATGAASAGNPNAGNSDPNAQRIVAYGLRNPFRFTMRPGTNEIWAGDVGYNTWEEIDRVVTPTAAPASNFGWPCYEGNSAQPGYQSDNLNLCSTLYSAGTAKTPYYTYNHGATVVSGETCPTGSSSISGLAFYGSGTYPSSFNNALFFADHSRNCIWAMKTGSNGLPDPTKIETFVAQATNPVDLQIGPGGDLWYVDYDGGSIHRIVYNATNRPPVAVIAANPLSGSSPLTVAFDGSGSSDPDPGDTLTYSWDLNGDGTFGDATLKTASFTYATAGLYTVGLRVTDSHGATASTTKTITVDNVSAPTVVIDSPSSSFTWAVGDPIAFAGHATDFQGHAIAASGLSWSVILHHCPSNCHTHDIQEIAGVASGTFPAPDHDYPSYLEIILTATDSGGRTATRSVTLQPKTVQLTLNTMPSGLSVVVGAFPPATTPAAFTVISGSQQSISATSPQALGPTYAFDHWSDGGLASHNVTVPANGLTLTATYVQIATTAYLSDLPFTQVANGWGPVERDMSNGEQAAGDGKPLSLRGVVYAKGLGAHAASDVRYAMNGGCTSFTTKVGVDDETGSSGSVDFQVFADGTKLADSGVVTPASATQTLTVDVTGRTTLQLVITDGGNGNAYDHGDWADAKLTCGGAPVDTTPPTVTATNPADTATGVAVGIAPTATFSEAIDPTTLTTATMTLVAQGTTTPLAASVAYNPGTKTATLTPSAALATSTTYVLRIVGGSTGVADLAGNRLAIDVTAMFTTSSGTSSTAYLSDLPFTQVANGWGPVERDMSNGEQAAGDGKPLSLRGVVYAKGLGAHAASDVRYAMNGGCTSFTTKVGVDDETGSSGSVDFQVFADGTKLADSGVVTPASATQTLTVDVTGRTTLQLVITDGGNGNAYDHGDWADAKLTCGGAPVDTTPPTVTATNPADTATGVAVGIAPTATFSEAIDPTTLTTATMTLVAQGTTTPLAASVAYNPGTKTATLTPSAALATSTTYVLRIVGGSTGVADLAGNRLAIDVTAMFTTSSGTSSTAYLSDLPFTQVANGWGPVERDMSNGEQAAGDGKPLSLRGVVYAKGLGAHAASDVRYAMNGGCTSFTTKVGVDDETGSSGSVDFQVFADGTKLADSGVVTPASATQTLTVDVTGRTTLQLVITDGGNGNAYDHGDWADAKLTCGGAPVDTTPPTVTATNPADTATGVAVGIAPTATFSEAIDPTTLTTATMTLVAQGTTTPLAASVAYNPGTKTATLTPSAALATSTTYVLRIVGGSTGVADLAGNRLAIDVTAMFTTSSGTSSTAYLSDLPFTQVANGWGPVERDMSNGEQAAGDGKPLSLRGVVYAKGLGAHAASDVRYAMNGGCTSFTTKVGVDDETGSSGSVDFQVFADGTKLADSGVVTPASATQTLTVDVTGRTTLQLVITDGGNGIDYDHGDWADAKLTCG